VQAERPDVVDGNKVLSVGQYYVLLIENLEKAGLCADFDGEEIQVKNSNDFNDQYHVMTSLLLLQRGQKAYRATCYPAAFPTPAPVLPETPGCSLKPSKEKACGREKPAFLAQVDAAIQKVADEVPDVLDKNDVRGGPSWYRIVKFDAYLDAVIRNLVPRDLLPGGVLTRCSGQVAEHLAAGDLVARDLVNAVAVPPD
jgi:hypothetical protein